jgi:phosphoglucosamine mutase
MKNLRKLFGTDGIRGVANRDLTPEFVLRIGKAGARFLSADSKNRKIVVGRHKAIGRFYFERSFIRIALKRG